MHKAIWFRYINHRGEVGLRHVQPQKITFMATQWHPEAQWILVAYDLDKGEVRFFALKDCNFAITS